MRDTKRPEHQDDKKDEDRDRLLALFRILMKEPPPEHDFKTCPICKEFGITEI